MLLAYKVLNTLNSGLETVTRVLLYGSYILARGKSSAAAPATVLLMQVIMEQLKTNQTNQQKPMNNPQQNN